MKNLKKLGKVLSTKEQKNVNGGRPPFQACSGSGSGINCTSVGNAGCPAGEGCFLEEDFTPIPQAYCHCL